MELYVKLTKEIDFPATYDTGVILLNQDGTIKRDWFDHLIDNNSPKESLEEMFKKEFEEADSYLVYIWAFYPEHLEEELMFSKEYLGNNFYGDDAIKLNNIDVNKVINNLKQ